MHFGAKTIAAREPCGCAAIEDGRLCDMSPIAALQELAPQREAQRIAFKGFEALIGDGFGFGLQREVPGLVRTRHKDQRAIHRRC